MALARARRDSGMNYWPGFVDALSTLILGIIFVLTMFAVVQYYLTQEVTGKDTALSRLTAQIAQLTELLSLEKTGKLSLEEQLNALRSSLATSEGERDRYKGLYEGIGSGAADAQSKAADLDLANGRVDDAFDRLLGVIRRTSGEERDQARRHLIGLFDIFPPGDPRVAKARSTLSILLFLPGRASRLGRQPVADRADSAGQPLADARRGWAGSRWLTGRTVRASR